MKPLNRLSVKWVLFLLLCLKAIKHGTCKKSCCNTSYVQASWVVCLVAWSGNNQDLCLCLWFPSLAFSWHVKSWTLPLYGFWLWLVRECEYRHTDQKRQECHHQQDDYACMLLLAPVIVAITFLVAAISLHYWGSRLSSNVMSSSWCDFVTIEITVSANII